MPGLYGRSGSTIMLPPMTRSRSLRLSGAAWTRTRTSPGSGLGNRHRVEMERLVRRSVVVGAPRPHRRFGHSRIVTREPPRSPHTRRSLLPVTVGRLETGAVAEHMSLASETWLRLRTLVE